MQKFECAGGGRSLENSVAPLTRNDHAVGRKVWARSPALPPSPAAFYRCRRRPPAVLTNRLAAQVLLSMVRCYFFLHHDTALYPVSN